MSKQIRTSSLTLFAAFVLWLCSFSPFLSGAIVITGDTLTNYCILKFYFNNLLNGVLPLWDPYLYLGRPFLYIGTSGALNPFAYLIPALVVCGLTYYQAYVVFITVYYFLGILGFYFLTRQVLVRNSESVIAAVLLMFSGMGAVLWNQIFILYLFVPSVWFFTFLLQFIRTFERRYFVGLLFASMMILVSYLPFYFLTLFLAVVVWWMVLYSRDVPKIFAGTFQFICRHKKTVIISIVLLSLASVPLVIFKRINDKAEFMAPARHGNLRDQKDAQMSLMEAATHGTLGERIKGGRLFSHLDNFSYFSDDFFYIPVWAWLVIATTLMVPLTRSQALLFGSGFVVFILSLGVVTPFYGILFEHVFYFKFFRNLFFYMAFVIPWVILFSIGQLREFLERISHFNSMKGVLSVFIVHLCFMGVLIWQGDVLVSTYMTVALSFCFFILALKGKRNLLILACIAMAVVLEPMEVYVWNTTHNMQFSCRLPSEHSTSDFSFVRPMEDIAFPCLLASRIHSYNLFIHLACLKDTSGIINWRPDFLSGSLVEFFRKYGLKKSRDYQRYKFWIYEKVPDDIALWEGKSLEANSPQLTVNHFNVNAIEFETDFPSTKFIILTDAFSKDWKAYMDGNPQKLYAAAGTFKGVLIPPGRHKIRMDYHPFGDWWIYTVVVGGLFGVLFWCLWCWRKAPQENLKQAGQESFSNGGLLRKSGAAYLFAFAIMSSGIDVKTMHDLRYEHLRIIYKFSGNRPQDGILFYDYCVHLNPEDAQAWAELGKNYALVGDQRRAHQAYQKVQTLTASVSSQQ